jgi:hypothetical protein
VSVRHTYLFHYVANHLQSLCVRGRAALKEKELRGMFKKFSKKVFHGNGKIARKNIALRYRKTKKFSQLWRKPITFHHETKLKKLLLLVEGSLFLCKKT